MHEDWQARGLKVFALNVPQFSEDAATIAAFKDQAGLSYPVLNHQGTAFKINFPGNNTFPYPRDAIIGKDGKIVYTSNTYDPEGVRAMVDALLDVDYP